MKILAFYVFRLRLLLVIAFIWHQSLLSSRLTALVTHVLDQSTAPPLSRCYREVPHAAAGKRAYEPVWPSGKALSPFLTGRMFVRRTYFGQFDEL